VLVLTALRAVAIGLQAPAQPAGAWRFPLVLARSLRDLADPTTWRRPRPRQFRAVELAPYCTTIELIARAAAAAALVEPLDEGRHGPAAKFAQAQGPDRQQRRSAAIRSWRRRACGR
jgi:hypothetical protein